MQYENPYALHLSKLAAIRVARDAETLRIVLAAGRDGITSQTIREMTGMSGDQCKNSLLRVRDAGLIECGTAREHEWRWGAIGIRERLSEQAKERRRLSRMSPGKSLRSNAARRMKREQMQREDEAASDAWARESIRRIVPATDAEPIRPERPMSIFEMGAA